MANLLRPAARRGVAATAAGAAKARQLQAEAAGWAAPNDPAAIPFATAAEVPQLDLEAADFPARLREASQDSGFYLLFGHGVAEGAVADGMAAAAEFHGLEEAAKLRCAMDAPGFPTGTGYLACNNFKLPARAKGNQNAAFIVKREHGPRGITLDAMPWPAELGPAWRARVERYAATMEALARRMLPKYAAALGLPDTYFDPAFQSPLWRLRMGMYPAVEGYEAAEYGIAPHVDTSFVTILAQGAPGLVVWNEAAAAWRRVPHLPGALVVNTGEILRTVTNDTWPATRHYALHACAPAAARYSLPFFFSPTADYPVAVAPTTVSAARPAKYAPTSYLQGQGVAQGE
eukprot:TRINITY_DN14387_c0_g1_i1.p1 TRINITY_DN14387_c0_g1~~TRINITY_DN14387_c0_g1_i1.p1  ORF type:complete len:361 (+),score=145.47 TRINITY_DN14387_c0_g1_i1:47-1084(+)